MGKIRKSIERISGNVIARNLILAVSLVVIFIFVVGILLNIFTRHNRYKTVPDFTGIQLVDALSAARHASLRIEVNDSLYVPAYEGGVVLDQLPEAGTQVKSGRRIFVTVNSFRQRMVDVPYVAGYSLRQAKNILEVAGLEIDRLVYVEDLAENNVLEQRYRGQTIGPDSSVRAEIGSGITLVVGRGAATGVSVPKVVGFPLQEARSRLWEAGLNVGGIDYDEDVAVLARKDARVYLQLPGQGSVAVPGGTVSLRLTLDGAKVEQGSAESDKAARRMALEREREQEEAIENGTDEQP